MQAAFAQVFNAVAVCSDTYALSAVCVPFCRSSFCDNPTRTDIDNLSWSHEPLFVSLGK